MFNRISLFNNGLYGLQRAGRVELFYAMFVNIHCFHHGGGIMYHNVDIYNHCIGNDASEKNLFRSLFYKSIQFKLCFIDNKGLFTGSSKLCSWSVTSGFSGFGLVLK